MPNSLKQRWVIDSIEASIASVEVDGATMITVPMALLPSGIKQGDIVSVGFDGAQTSARTAVVFEIDEAAIAQARAHSAAQVGKAAPQGNDPGGDLHF
ncbi:MAG: DUF3006 domain-containing protein [Gemmatimonadota bacterium]|nr:DUF3006 domain-containing protein [Gemmatimonadota bacterium]